MDQLNPANFSELAAQSLLIRGAHRRDDKGMIVGYQVKIYYCLENKMGSINYMHPVASLDSSDGIPASKYSHLGGPLFPEWNTPYDTLCNWECSRPSDWLKAESFIYCNEEGQAHPPDEISASVGHILSGLATYLKWASDETIIRNSQTHPYTKCGVDFQNDDYPIEFFQRMNKLFTEHVNALELTPD